MPPTSNEIKVLSAVEKSTVERKVGSGASGKDVVDSLEVSFQSLLWGLELKKAQQRIAVIEAKTSLTKQDFLQLELLRKTLSTGKTLVENEAGHIFKLIRTGHLNDAKLASEEFLRIHNEDDLLGANVLGIRELTALKVISKETLEVASKFRNKPGINEKDALELVKSQERMDNTTEKLFGGRKDTESKLDTSIRDIQLKDVRSDIRQDYDELTSSATRSKSLKETAKEENSKLSKKTLDKKIVDSLDRKKPSRGKDLKYSGRELKRRMKSLETRREKQSNMNNEEKLKELVEQWQGDHSTPEARRDAAEKLKVLYEILGDDLDTLDAAKKYYVFDGVDLNTGIVRPNEPSALYFVDRGGVKKIVLYLDQDSIQDRVLSITNHLKFEDESRDDDLRLLVNALTRSGGVASAEARAVAEDIYKRLGAWHKLYEPYKNGIQNYREKLGTVIKRTVHARGESMFPSGRTGIKGESFLSPDLVTIDVNGDIQLNEKGKKRLELVRGLGYLTKMERNELTGEMEEVIVAETIEQRMARAGSYENDQYAAHSYEQLKRFSKAERARQFGTIRGVQMMFPDIDENSDRAEVEKAIKEVVLRVFGSDDSSRDQRNFDNMTNLVYLITLPQVDSNFKNLWMARLAVHDVNMVMGGAENGEDMTRLRSFIPKEYWDVLLGSGNYFDPLDGRFFDSGGNALSINIHSRDIMDELEMQVPGRKNARDNYIVEILGATDQEDLSVQWRRFAANTVGKRFGEGIQCQAMGDGTFKVVAGDEYVKLADGTRIHYLNLFGLDKDGNMLKSVPGREEWFKKVKEYDVFDQYGVFFQQGMVMGHLKDRTVAAEKGGNYKGKMLRYLPNVLRKMYGGAQKHYFHQKDMTEVVARGHVDSFFRTQYAWHFQKRDIYLHTVDEKLRADLQVVHGGNGSAINRDMDGFWKVLDRIAYAPEKFHALEGLNGELRFNADVRWIAAKPELRMYQEIFAEYRASGLGPNFNWKPVLERMGVDPSVYRGRSIKGEAGLQIFMENYRLFGLLDIDALPHNEGADWAKYDGKSEAQFTNAIKYCENPQDPNLRFAYAKEIDGYLGNDGREIKLARLTYDGQRRDASSLDGYRTYGEWVDDGMGGKRFVEKSVIWKVPMRGGGVDLTTDEGKHYAKWNQIHMEETGTELIVTEEGLVIDENFELQYRPDTIGVTQGIGTFGAPKGLGSFTGDRNLKRLTWHERKEEMEKMRRLGGFRRERFTEENRRFKAQLYFGAEVPIGKKVELKTIVESLRKKPYKFFLLPATIMRGIIIDLNLDWGDWLAFWEPIGGELKKQGVWV